MSNSSLFRKIADTRFVYTGRRNKGFFYTDDEGRVRFAGGPGSGGGRAKPGMNVPINIENRDRVRSEIESKYPSFAIDAALTKLREDIDKSEIQINIKPHAFLEGVLESGEFRNQHSTHTSGGVLDSDFRLQAEQTAFGGGLSKPEELPIYGWIPTSIAPYGGDMYGEISVVLRSEVKNRATVTVGDSLGNFFDSKVAPSPSLNLGPECLDENINSLGKFSAVRVGYIEAQIFGPVTLADIEYVDLTRAIRMYRGYDDDMLNRLTSGLDARGIKWVDRGEE